ncbi:MAG: nitroreductase family protein [Erysipelotrichaceae bacterium]|nr:nitroreductase family protein [Erysipelotrichaceae bacterium]
MSSIYHRVSIRRFQDRDVEDDKIREILRAGMQAPSANNQQPWEFYVVKNREILEKLSTAHRYASCTKDAPAAIVSAYQKDCHSPDYAQIDMSIAMENIWLRTDELGLGGVWLGIAPREERMRYVEEVIGMPESLRAFAIFPLGYPFEERRQEDRYEEDRIHYCL